VTGNYFDYPTSSNISPSNVLGNPIDPENNATYSNNGYTIGSPYYRTEVGAHENSVSPYGTFDQGGNVWEWNEAVINLYRGLRGGSVNEITDDVLLASHRFLNDPSVEGGIFGFRLAYVPETSSILLAVLGGWALVMRKR